jgi:hypothetical protein
LETLLVTCGFIKLEGAGSAVKFYHQKKDILINLHKPHPSNILKIYIVTPEKPTFQSSSLMITLKK